MNFWYEWIFEYIFFQKTIRMNIRIYSYQKNDTNEYPNIFVSKKWYERISEYIRIKQMIRIWYERIFVSENIRIYEYIHSKFLIFDVGFSDKAFRPTFSKFFLKVIGYEVIQLLGLSHQKIQAPGIPLFWWERNHSEM